MKTHFIPISLSAYVEKHLQANPDFTREEVVQSLQSALQAYRSGVKCECGNPLWVIGSAMTGHACFTCITGEADPSDDFGIDEACGEGG